MAKGNVSKESLPGDLPTSRRRKALPFNVPKTKATKDQVKRNAKQSALLSLPLELKEPIWKEVFGGGRILHIKNMEAEPRARPLIDDWLRKKWTADNFGAIPSSPWLTSLCVANNIEDKSYKYWDPSNPSALPGNNEPQYSAEWGMEGNVQIKRCSLHPIHREIYLYPRKTWSPWALSDFSEFYARRDSIDLRVLRTSRQVYQEANALLWATPVFSFSDGTTFVKFMQTRTLAQKRLLHKLHIQSSGRWKYGRPELSYFPGPARSFFVKTVPNLKEVQLSFNLSDFSSEFCDLDRKNDDVFVFDVFDQTVHEFFALQYHQLKEVNVTFTHEPQGLAIENELVAQWSDRVSRKIKAKLLDPNGRKICEEQEANLKEDRRLHDEKKLVELRSQLCLYTAAQCKANRQWKRDNQDANLASKGRHIKHIKPVTPCQKKH